MVSYSQGEAGSWWTGAPMPLSRGFFLTFCTATLISAQSESRKELTPRELFYAAAQAPAAKSAPARPAAARSAPRVAKPAPKPVETPVPVVKTAVQTAPMPASGEPPLGIRYTILKINSDNSTA